MPKQSTTVRLAIAGFVALCCALAGATDVRAELWPESYDNPHVGGITHFETNGFPLDEDEFPVELVLVGPTPDGVDRAEVEEAIEYAAET
ncbi:MAG: hypothetical protein ACOCV2_06495, partial [Persicimonas sp.]